MHPSGIITLTTDFGLSDSYVGIMKGVILGIAPEARIIDITHNINPQDLHQSAYMVQTYFRYFPPGTVHLVVVDPGVGSARRGIALRTPDAVFVAPDNGVLTYICHDIDERGIGDLCEAVELTERRYWLPNVGSTFHGRDIFAPVAAHLSRGVALSTLGPPTDQLAELELEQPANGRRGGLLGRIIHVDHFGNCITNVTMRDLERAGLHKCLVIEIIDQRIPVLSRTYSDGPVGGLMALIGSAGRLELAVRNGSAARMLGVGIGDIVRIREP